MYGQKNAPDIYFNRQRIKAVQSYKYLRNIISTISSAKGDIFCENYSYLCNQAKKALFGMKQKLSTLANFLPKFCFICLKHLYVQYYYTGVIYGEFVSRAIHGQ